MADCPSTAAWIDKAEEDARAARVLSSTDQSAFGGTIAFHCQQSAEKYLKACLVQARQDFPKTHDFEALITLCLRVSPSFAELSGSGQRLQPFAVAVRYPYAVPEPAEVRQALEDMEAIRRTCRSFLDLAQP